MLKKIWILFALCVLLGGCSAAERSDTGTVETIINQKESEAMKEEDRVLEAYKTMQQAMIDKDIETLDRIVKDGTTFTHMSGKTQTKDEYFGEIADGTLNYYKYKIADCEITVSGDTATLTANVTLTAKVYGMSGSWTLPVNAHFERINDDWIYSN